MNNSKWGSWEVMRRDEWMPNSISYLTREAPPMRDPAAKILGNCLAHVSKRGPHAKIHSRAASGGIRQDRHVLARVVGRRPARIGVAAMIRSDYQQVRSAEKRQK